VGTSGGVWGLDEGYSMMVGGSDTVDGGGDSDTLIFDSDGGDSYERLDHGIQVEFDTSTEGKVANVGDTSDIHVNFENVEVFDGTQYNDTFLTTDAGMHITVDGGDGYDTVGGGTNAFVATMDGDGDGSISVGGHSQYFMGMEYVLGSSEDDEFVFQGDAGTGVDYDGAGNISGDKIVVHDTTDFSSVGSLDNFETVVLNNNESATFSSDLVTGKSWYVEGYSGGNEYVSIIGTDGADSVDLSTWSSLDLEYFQVEGLAGEDHLIGSSGVEHIYGGDGDDTVEGGDGVDDLDGGGGTNTLSFASGNQGADVDLGNTGSEVTNDGWGNSENLTDGTFQNLDGSAQNDTLEGDANANIIAGHNGADNLTGNAGDDVLWGEYASDSTPGVDNIDGGVGNDILIGGGEEDDLTGGDGDDIFFYQSFSDGGTNGDVIGAGDFGTGNDVIGIYTSAGSDFSSSLPTSGKLPAVDFGQGAAAPSNQTVYFYYDSANHNLWYDEDADFSTSGDSHQLTNFGGPATFNVTTEVNEIEMYDTLPATA
jgi:Ca2+-binding RTX toxin-like protein